MKQRHQENENPPLNCRNGEGILQSPLLCSVLGLWLFLLEVSLCWENRLWWQGTQWSLQRGPSCLPLFSVTHPAGPGEPVLMHAKSLFLIFCFCNMTYCCTTSSWGRAVWGTSVAVPAVRVLPLFQPWYVQITDSNTSPNSSYKSCFLCSHREREGKETLHG